jgi:rhomboid protease GluP
VTRHDRDDHGDDELALLGQQLARATPMIWVTQTIVAINVLVWLANIATGVDFYAPSAIDLVRWGGNTLGLTLQQPWRLLTATVLHGGIVHLGFNMWALWSLGRLAERFYGNKQYILIYGLSGLFASLASLFFAAKLGVSVGASGAIFGVVGALLAAIYTKQSKLPRTVVVALRASLLPFIAFSLFMGFTTGHIDNAAHLGGLAAGFVLASVMAEKFDWEQYQRQMMPRVLASLLLSALIGYAIWNFLPTK